MVKRARLKWYYDAEGQLQSIEVYRYYCRNRVCDKGSFTNLPSGLVPYSRYRTEVKVRAVQMSAWSYELLPVAALFGVVRSSGVVGIDEKYVLVPKNDKPAGDSGMWK